MATEIIRRRFTADDYQRMGEAGIFVAEDRVELIDGEIIAMTPIGPRHMAVVDRVNRAFVIAAGKTAIVRVQGSVRLDFYSEPEPDVVLLSPRGDFYASRMAGPADILLVVEVAQSSVDYDRGMKKALYARAGVREFWLIDLTEDVLESFAEPMGGLYRESRSYRRGESLSPRLLPHCVVGLNDLIGEDLSDTHEE
jgi:Uma2 family endonuclease